MAVPDTSVSRVHYGKLGLCRVFWVHGNAFVVRFFSETHGKGRTTDYCTVNDLCRASCIAAHGKEGLPCVSYDTRQKK
jgi:hypothetical protein